MYESVSWLLTVLLHGDMGTLIQHRWREEMARLFVHLSTLVAKSEN